MAFKSLLVLFLILVSSPSHSAECLLNQILKDAKLAENAAFWDEYGALAAKGKVSDRQLEELAKKFGGLQKAEKTVAASKGFQKSMEVSYQARAEKEISGLPEHLKEKVADFAKVISEPGGFHTIRESTSWHVEKLIQFGNNAFTVRANDGYRILFDYVGDTVTIRRVNKGFVHRN